MGASQMAHVETEVSQPGPGSTSMNHPRCRLFDQPLDRVWDATGQKSFGPGPCKLALRVGSAHFSTNHGNRVEI